MLHVEKGVVVSILGIGSVLLLVAVVAVDLIEDERRGLLGALSVEKAIGGLVLAHKIIY